MDKGLKQTVQVNVNCDQLVDQLRLFLALWRTVNDQDEDQSISYSVANRPQTQGYLYLVFSGVSCETPSPHLPRRLGGHWIFGGDNNEQ
jgi:hypothetical protein